MDRNNRTRVAVNLAGDCRYYPRSRDLALRPEIYSPLHRVSVVAAVGGAVPVSFVLLVEEGISSVRWWGVGLGVYGPGILPQPGVCLGGGLLRGGRLV